MEEILINKEFKYDIIQTKNRTIYSPNDKLKFFQRNILRKLKQKFPLSMSIKEAAEIHTNQKYLLKMDIEHFFDSVPKSRIDNVIRKLSFFGFNKIKKATTISNKLPAGACTSSHIANACMIDIDRDILKFCTAKSIKYSRYMDDLFFSADNKDVLNSTEEFVKTLLAKNSMKINQNKVKYVSANKKQVIMGLLVNKDFPCLTKETKRKIRAILHGYMCGKTDDERYVAGYLSYVYNVDPEYFIRLSQYYKHYKEKYSVPAERRRIIGKILNCNLRKI